MPEQRALLEAAAKLQVATEQLGEKFEAVDLFAHETAEAHGKTRQLTRWLVVGMLTQLVVIAVLAVALERVDDASNRIDDQVEADVASCERGNDTRAAQRKQWTDTRDLLIRLGAGAETRKLANGLVANATANFPHLDCSRIREGQKPGPIAPPT